MKSIFSNRLVLLSLAAASFSLCGLFERPASAQECPIAPPSYSGQILNSDITYFPNYYKNYPADYIGKNTPSQFIVDVINPLINGPGNVANPNPPIPYAQYYAWCVDMSDLISPEFSIVPLIFYRDLILHMRPRSEFQAASRPCEHHGFSGYMEGSQLHPQSQTPRLLFLGRGGCHCHFGRRRRFPVPL